MLSRIRAHGNFTENAPLALLGLIGLAMLNAHPIALHIFGLRAVRDAISACG